MSAVDAAQQQQSVRYSTYSGAPSLHPSIAPTMDSNSARNSASGVQERDTPNPSIARSASVASSATDARSADIKGWAAGFDRMTDRRLEEQRFVPSGQKTDEISTNALGAKLERALGRRMSEQDAISKETAAMDEKLDEKPIEVTAQ